MRYEILVQPLRLLYAEPYEADRALAGAQVGDADMEDAVSPQKRLAQSENARVGWSMVSRQKRAVRARMAQSGRFYAVTCSCQTCPKCRHRAAKAKWRQTERDFRRAERRAEMRNYRAQIAAGEWWQGDHTRRTKMPFSALLAAKEAELWKLI